MKKLLYILLFISFGASAQKYSILPAATTIGASDIIPIVQGGVNKKAAYSLFGGGTSIETAAAIASTGTVPLTFDVIRYFQKTTQTGNITLSLAASGHLNGRTQVIDIDGNSTGTFTFPANWDNGNGVTFDNTKNNQIYLDYVNGRVTYNVKKGVISAGPDLTVPVITSASTNAAGTIITLTYNEALGAVIPSISNFITSPAKTISSVSVAGSTVLVTITPAFVNGNVITISYTAGTNKIQDVAGNFASNLTAYSVTNNVPVAGDVTAPILSSPTATSTGSTTATLGVTTNEANGTLYAVVTTSTIAPSPAQVKLGQNNGGTAAAYSGNQAITTTGAKTFSATGLTASTVYYSYFMQEDASANQSTVSAATSITTSAAFNTKSASFGDVNQIAKSTSNPANLSFGSGGTDLPFSIDFWVKWATSGAATQRILGLTNTTGSTGAYSIEISPTGLLTIQLFSGSAGNMFVTTSTGLTSGVWTHITATYNANKLVTGLNIYKNGAFQTTTSAFTTYTGMVAGDAARVFTIGGSNVAGFEFPATNCLIDEVSVYNVELNNTQVTEVYNAGTVKDKSTLSFNSSMKIWARFTDNLNDSSTGGNNMTSVVSPTYSTDKP